MNASPFEAVAHPSYKFAHYVVFKLYFQESFIVCAHARGFRHFLTIFSLKAFILRHGNGTYQWINRASDQYDLISVLPTNSTNVMSVYTSVFVFSIRFGVFHFQRSSCNDD